MVDLQWGQKAASLRAVVDLFMCLKLLWMNCVNISFLISAKQERASLFVYHTSDTSASNLHLVTFDLREC